MSTWRARGLAFAVAFLLLAIAGPPLPAVVIVPSFSQLVTTSSLICLATLGETRFWKKPGDDIYLRTDILVAGVFKGGPATGRTLTLVTTRYDAARGVVEDDPRPSRPAARGRFCSSFPAPTAPGSRPTRARACGCARATASPIPAAPPWRRPCG